MNKSLFIIGSFVIALVGILASFAAQRQVYATTCDSNGNLFYNQAVEAYATGAGTNLLIVRSPDLTANRVTVTITNNTSCGLPVSLASYKLFEAYNPATVSQQEFFDGSQTINVAASSTKVLSVALPPCESQYDLWYGDVVHVQIDNHSYGEFIAGDQVRLGQYCLHPVVAPAQATLHIIKHVDNSSGGTSTAALFSIHVRASGTDVVGSPATGAESPGTAYLLATGTYMVSEGAVTGYTLGFSGDCDAHGSITLVNTDSKTCTLTNTDAPVTAPVATTTATTTLPITTNGMPPAPPPQTVIQPVTSFGGGGGCSNCGGSVSYVPLPTQAAVQYVPIVNPVLAVARSAGFPNAGIGPPGVEPIPWMAFCFMGILIMLTVMGRTYMYVTKIK
jgi:hypothetical protein